MIDPYSRIVIKRMDAIEKSRVSQPFKRLYRYFEKQRCIRHHRGQGGIAPLRGVGQRPTKRG
jgi:hypothetical protein